MNVAIRLDPMCPSDNLGLVGQSMGQFDACYFVSAVWQVSSSNLLVGSSKRPVIAAF